MNTERALNLLRDAVNDLADHGNLDDPDFEDKELLAERQKQIDECMEAIKFLSELPEPVDSYDNLPSKMKILTAREAGTEIPEFISRNRFSTSRAVMDYLATDEIIHSCPMSR